MTPKNRDAALVEYQRQIGKVLNCVANCWVYAYPSRKAGQYMLIAAPADAEKTDKASEYFLRVKRGKEVLFFRGYQFFEVFDDDSFRISTLKYYYSIWPKQSELLIDFHYHERKADLYKGHLHIPPKPGVAPVHFLINKHIPTARIPIEDVVRFMITEVGVTPRTDAWQSTLDETEAIFSANRTK